MVHLPVYTKRSMDNLLASARSSTGLVGARTYTQETFKGPCGAYLAAIKYLNKNQPYIRAIRKKGSCNLQILKNVVDIDMGLKEPGISDFTRNLLRQIFAYATSEEGTLPASFYKVCKSENNVKTSDGVLAKLGYLPLIPSVEKVIKVSTTEISRDTTTGLPVKLLPYPKECVLRHNQEFYMGVKLLLPLVYDDGVNPSRNRRNILRIFFLKSLVVFIQSITS